MFSGSPPSTLASNRSSLLEAVLWERASAMLVEEEDAARRGGGGDGDDDQEASRAGSATRSASASAAARCVALGGRLAERRAHTIAQASIRSGSECRKASSVCR